MIPALAFLVVAAASGLASPTADELIARHIAASGGAQALHAIRSLTFKSFDEKQALSPVFFKMRPDYSLIGCTRPDCGYAEGFDGHRAWEMQPRRGRVYTARGEAAKAIRRAGRFDFPFIEYREKGNVVRLDGTEVLDGKEMIRLAVHLSDGLDETFYFEPATMLVIANRRKVPMHARGHRFDAITRFSDYRPVAGYLYPFHLDSRDAATGEVLETGQWGAIVANEIESPDLFQAPAVSPPASAALVLHLYEVAPGRSGKVIVEEYVRFRKGHPEADTSSDLTWLGYQMLKDECPEKAILVFEQLVKEYPRSSDAWDSLGDAFEQGLDIARARDAFFKAVELDPKAEESAKKLARLKNLLRN